MIAKRHRQNHNFTILHNLVGDCHTADAAYALLHDLREDRQAAVHAYTVSDLRNEAKEIRALKMLESEDLAIRKEGEAELLELSNNRAAGALLLSAAQDEIAFIDRCLEELQPLRKHAHLSDAEAVEACQAEEWRLELLRRAENFLLTTGTIHPDQFETMRQHPAFATDIFPRINEMQALMGSPEGRQQLMAQIGQRPKLLNGTNT